MQKEVISSRQAILILTMFIFASNILIGSRSKVGQDTWIALVLSLIFTMPTVLLYGRILKLFPEMTLSAILISTFGKILGRIILALMTWYAISLGSLVMSNFYFFVGVTTLQSTPHLYVAGIMLIACLYMAKSGIEVFGKWSHIAFPIAVITMLITVILSFNRYEFGRIQPIGNHPIGELTNLAFSQFTFPFAETVLFLFFGHALRKEYSSYRIYVISSLLGFLILWIIVVRNILVLGPEMMSAVYFPSFTAARIISVGSFLTRIEGTISMNFILSGVVKITLCLIAASIGTAGLLGVENYKTLVVPVGMLIFALCMINYPSILDMMAFIEVYQYYAIPFQLVIPIAIWVTAEISAKRKSGKMKKSA